MMNSQEVFYNKILEHSGWNDNLISADNINSSSLKISPTLKYYAKSLFEIDDNGLDIDSIFVSGKFPFIFIKKLSSFDPNIVRKLHQKLWNESKAPLLAIITPTELNIYDCFNTPIDNIDDIKQIEVDSFQNTQNDLLRLRDLLHQSVIDSGQIWENPNFVINTGNRVNLKLVKNLAYARNKLFDAFGIPLPIIHDLLGRSLFSLYLQDRCGIDYKKLANSTAIDFFELLDDYEATYIFFSNLNKIFNGDIFPVTNEELTWIKKNPRALQTVKDCFWGNAPNGQLTMWRMFQFQYIPIGLISSIYEEFISQEDEQHNKIDLRRNGVYYTPFMLVDFILDEVFPYPDHLNTNYDKKILDPACGSGIFLVESYKRLIARWRFTNPDETLSKEILLNLLMNNIFGIEIDPQAIKIAAFSLYLTLLSFLEPRTILNNVKLFKPLIWQASKVGTNSNGKNLFQADTFSEELPVFKNKLDFIIGNPPWKRGNDARFITNYRNQHNPNLPSDIVCAFMDYLPKQTPNVKIALIISAKILFNTNGNFKKFRTDFFSNNTIDLIVNLSTVRDIIFKKAKAPAAIIIYSVGKPLKQNNIPYCVPKDIRSINNRESLIIDSTEIKYLPIREIVNSDSFIFKVAMWGNIRDLRLVDRFKESNKLCDTLDAKYFGTGLHKAGEKKGNKFLKNYLFIDTDNITRYYVDKKRLSSLGDNHDYYRPFNKEIFTSPTIIIKEGTENGNICAAYIPFNCTHKVYGIKYPRKSVQFHKALVAYINSSFSHYYIFLTSGSWGVDKAGRNQNNAIMELPATILNFSRSSINSLASIVDEIIKLKKDPKLILEIDQQISELEKRIDDLIYDELNFSKIDRMLIEDLLKYSSGLNQRYINCGAEKVVNVSRDLKNYAEVLTSSLNTTLNNIGKSASYIIHDSRHLLESTRMVSLVFSDSNSINVNRIDNQDYSSIFSSINRHMISQNLDSVYYRKTVRYFKENKIYIIKLNQKKFWSTSQALNDSDSILLELLD